jgi:diacylglycerol kinase (ATP)
MPNLKRGTQLLPLSAAPSAAAAYKSKDGARRVVDAARYSLAGMRAAWKHEAAFRQEVLLALPLMALLPWLAPSLMFGVLMAGSILLVFCVEMLNSAIEALADAISVDHNPTLGRAKDLGSAAVMFVLVLAAAVWGAALYTRFYAG